MSSVDSDTFDTSHAQTHNTLGCSSKKPWNVFLLSSNFAVGCKECQTTVNKQVTHHLIWRPHKGNPARVDRISNEVLLHIHRQFAYCSCFVQIRTTATGLTTSAGGAIDYATAVAAIAKLRDVLGGTSSASVENSLARTPTAYSDSTSSTGPVMFAHQ